MNPIVVTVGSLAAASANNIALSQSPAVAGNITLNGALVVAGVAVLDKARRVLLTTAADETTKTFTVTGTNWAGDTISEVITGVNNSTAASVLSYKTVTSIAASAATAGAITFGTNGVADSPWVRLDSWANPTVAIQCTVSGTVNYTVQQTMDDPNSPTNPVVPSAMTWVSSADTAVVAATATKASSFTVAPSWARVLLSSGDGSVTTTFSQTGSVPY